jgi:hypothetical protein
VPTTGSSLHPTWRPRRARAAPFYGPGRRRRCQRRGVRGRRLVGRALLPISPSRRIPLSPSLTGNPRSHAELHDGDEAANNRRCHYLRRPALLPWAPVAAAMDVQRCSFGRPALLPILDGVAMGEGHNCYKAVRHGRARCCKSWGACGLRLQGLLP